MYENESYSFVEDISSNMTWCWNCAGYVSLEQNESRLVERTQSQRTGRICASELCSRDRAQSDAGVGSQTRTRDYVEACSEDETG